MYIKVYFGDKPVYLCDALDDKLKEILQHPDAVFIDEISPPAIKSLLHEIVKEQFHAGVLLDKDVNHLLNLFKKNFTVIEAAGGIVQNEHKEVLFINRLGKWDLPKGKVENHEDYGICALREVEEETGVKDLTLKKRIGETYHTYTAFGKHFFKTTYWFYMTCNNQYHLVPQAEEDIAEVKWIATKEIKFPVSNTYPAIKDILSKFFDEA
jgi:8-oxo-dGTP pyrophosphatase MutT (NUDIX family)